MWKALDVLRRCVYGQGVCLLMSEPRMSLARVGRLGPSKGVSRGRSRCRVGRAYTQEDPMTLEISLCDPGMLCCGLEQGDWRPSRHGHRRGRRPVVVHGADVN